MPIPAPTPVPTYAPTAKPTPEPTSARAAGRRVPSFGKFCGSGTSSSDDDDSEATSGLSVSSGDLYYGMTTAAALSFDGELWGCLATFASKTVNSFVQSFWYPDKTSLTNYAATLRMIETYLRRDLLIYGRLQSEPGDSWSNVEGYSCYFETASCDWEDECASDDVADDIGASTSSLTIQRGWKDLNKVAITIYRDVWFDLTLTMDGDDLTCTVTYDNGYTASVSATDDTYSSGSYGVSLYRNEIIGGCYEYYFQDMTYTEISSSALTQGDDDAGASEGGRPLSDDDPNQATTPTRRAARTGGDPDGAVGHVGERSRRAKRPGPRRRAVRTTGAGRSRRRARSAPSRDAARPSGRRAGRSRSRRADPQA